MLSNEEFVMQSVDLNLFFMRIMKEHMLFLEAGFTTKNPKLISESDMLKEEANRVLGEFVSLSNGLVSRTVINSGEIVTEYTLNAETATEDYTGINIDTGLTQEEKGLDVEARMPVNDRIVEQIRTLNQNAIEAVTSIIEFKENVLKDFLSCQIFTMNYPLLIDHILREAKLYQNMLVKLQNNNVIYSKKDIPSQEVFWNRIMAEHSKFIRGLLDPTEEQLMDTANMFANEFDQLIEESQKAQKQTQLIPEVTRDSLDETRRIRDFKRQGTEGLINCKVKSIILPLLGDHTLREANHYLRLLRMFERNV